MTTIIKINRIILDILISVLFVLIALQTAYAGGGEDDNKNSIIVTADGIAKITTNVASETVKFRKTREVTNETKKENIK